MDTEEEIRQREEQNEKNETPTVVDDDQGDQDDDPSSYGGIPTPSLSRKQWVAVGAVVGLVIAWKLYQSRSAGSGDSLNDAREELGDTETTVDGDDLEREDITVPNDKEDPLAGDEAITKEFRRRGIISETED